MKVSGVYSSTKSEKVNFVKVTLLTVAVRDLFQSTHLFRGIPCERQVQLLRKKTTMPLLEAIFSFPPLTVVKVITYGIAAFSKMLSPSLQMVRRKSLTCF